MNDESPEVKQRIFRMLAALSAIALSILAGLSLRTGVVFLDGFKLSLFAATLICWWFAFRGHIAADRVLIATIVRTAFIVGGICFAVGFVGPIIFTPQSNQGPLLGIFVTGPLGFVAGALIGFCVGVFRRIMLTRRDAL